MVSSYCGRASSKACAYSVPSKLVTISVTVSASAKDSNSLYKDPQGINNSLVSSAERPTSFAVKRLLMLSISAFLDITTKGSLISLGANLATKS